MAAKRLIGIDFGTSTSVIRVKRYENDQPIGDRLEAKAVTFNMGAGVVPTLIRKDKDGKAVYYGYEAETAKKGTTLYQNFKPELESDDPVIRERAQKLTQEYFRYLAKEYTSQSQGGHLGENTDETQTLVSYPVKWSRDAQEFMLETARNAGFPNVTGMNEAEAAIRAVTVQSADYLQQKGYFAAEKPVNILLIDMGAGTTDLVFCRYTQGEPPKVDILCTWPKRGNVLFGGREMDEQLRGFVTKHVKGDEAELLLRKLTIDQYKTWKEKTVSPALKRGETIDSFDALDTLADVLGLEIEFRLNRAELEKTADGYLRELPKLVNDCIQNAGFTGADVDLVILTGGHSQWYFVADMLNGKMKGYDMADLKKIRADAGRIIPIPRPQETVALGLVYSGLTKRQAVTPQDVHASQVRYVSRKEPTCTQAGHMAYYSKRDQKGKALFFLDEDCREPLSEKELYIPPRGHRFGWVEDGAYRVETCSRCGAEGRKELLKKKENADKKEEQPTPSIHEEVFVSPESDFELGQIGEDYCIRKYIGKAEVVSIPSEIRGRKVVAIGASAFLAPTIFSRNQKIKKVIIPETIKKIEQSAFRNCRSLEVIQAHPNIEVIDSCVFLFCFNLKYVDFGVGELIPKIVYFPKQMKQLGYDLFAGTPINEFHLSRQTKIAKKATFHGGTFLPNHIIFYYD